MKIIFITALVSIGLFSCGESYKNRITTTTALAVPSFETDTFFMLKINDRQIWRVNDVSLLKTWDWFPVILIKGDDSSQILHGKFHVYEYYISQRTWTNTYYDYYATNGVESIEFNTKNTKYINKGDSVYCFYQKRVCFKEKQIE
jgi:hypothetical protein